MVRARSRRSVTEVVRSLMASFKALADVKTLASAYAYMDEQIDIQVYKYINKSSTETEDVT